jgi:hypothetical protein
MARLKVETVIDASPSQVWNAIEDVSRHVLWMEDAVAIRMMTRQQSGVGTEFECDTRVGPLRLLDRMVITEWRPRRRMGVRHEGMVRGNGRFTLRRARGGRTRFRWDERLQFPLWMGGPVTATLAVPVLKRVWRRNLKNLKALVER